MISGLIIAASKAEPDAAKTDCVALHTKRAGIFFVSIFIFKLASVARMTWIIDARFSHSAYQHGGIVAFLISKPTGTNHFVQTKRSVTRDDTGSRSELAYPYHYSRATVKFVANVRRLTFRLRTRCKEFLNRKNYDSLTVEILYRWFVFFFF